MASQQRTRTTWKRTYEHPKIALNDKRRHCRNCGEIHEYHTKGCMPCVIPDEWQEDGLFQCVPIPEGVETVLIAEPT